MFSHDMVLIGTTSRENLSTRSDRNQPVIVQKMAKGLKFRIQVVEGLYYLFSKNKDTDQLHLCFGISKNQVFS